MGGNIRYLMARYSMSVKHIARAWHAVVNDHSDVVRVCEQVRELCVMRDKHFGILSTEDCNNVISLLCTE